MKRSTRAAASVPASRNDQLVRILRILRDLGVEGGATLYDLAERHGTTTRTIRRDFAALEQAGFEPECKPASEGSRKKVWTISFERKLGKLSSLLDASHYLALNVALAQGGVLHHRSHSYGLLEDLGQQIEEAVGKKGIQQLREIAQAFLPYHKGDYRNAPPDILWPLIGACAKNSLCRIEYQAPRAEARERTHEVLPLKIFHFQGAHYLLAYHPKHKRPVTFHLLRIRKIKVLAKTRRPHKDFNAAAWAESAFGVFTGGKPTTYRLAFSREAAPYIRERSWHPTETLTNTPNGGVLLEFRCGETFEVDAWVQSWGDQVEVHAPASVRRKLRALGGWLAETYAPAARPARTRRR